MATRETSPDPSSVPSPAFEASDYVDGEVLEVLEGIGLAHVRTADGTICGLTRSTLGIEFSQLRAGIRVRCKVVRKFSRVVQAKLMD